MLFDIDELFLCSVISFADSGEKARLSCAFSAFVFSRTVDNSDVTVLKLPSDDVDGLDDVIDVDGFGEDNVELSPEMSIDVG